MMSENDEATSRRTTKEIRQVWNDMFSEASLSSCKIETSKHLLKVSMLLKTLFNIHKSLVNTLVKQEKEIKNEKESNRKILNETQDKIRNQNDSNEQALKEKDEQITSLMEQIRRLKDPRNALKNSQQVLPCIDIGLSDSENSDMPEIIEPGTSSSSVKRLSEGDLEDLEIRSTYSTKKVKVDLSASTPTKDAQYKILAPETLLCDFEDNYKVSNNLCVTESLEILEDLDRSVVAIDVEMSPRKAQSSPATPKSPIINSHKMRKSHNEENKSPRYFSPRMPAPQLPTNQNSSPDKTKKLSKGLPVSKSPLKQTGSDIKVLSPVSKSSNPSYIHGITRLSKGKADKVLSPCRGNFSAEANVQENQTLVSGINGKQNKKQTSSYICNSKKLAIQPPDKTKKALKLKQTKLSLSMFQAKKAENEAKFFDENEQMQKAIEESVKLANQEEEKILFSPSPNNVKSRAKSVSGLNQPMDPNATFFESAEDNTSMFNDFPELGFNLLKCPVTVADKAEASTSIQKTTVAMEKEYSRDPDRGFKKKTNEGPSSAFIAPVVQKKVKGKQPEDGECQECKQFLEALCQNMTEEQRKELVNKCSKHRLKEDVYFSSSPPGLWEVAALQTPEGETLACEPFSHRRVVSGSRLIDKAVKVNRSFESDMSIL